MGSSVRIAVVMDDEVQRRRFADDAGPGVRIREAADGRELTALVASRAVDVIVAGVLNRNDEFLPVALREVARRAPELVMVGVFEPVPPSIDEAADLMREIPRMGFACRPGARLRHLIHSRTSPAVAPTVSPLLIGCMDRLPLTGAAKVFALLQALHPSYAVGIPEQARALGVSRRNLERWFQGPDMCSAGCFQSVCAAAEAAYLRLMRGRGEREIAEVVEVLTREGVPNPTGVARAIRSALRTGLEELRSGGMSALLEAVNTALRTPRDPTRVPAQWSAEMRYRPASGVLAVPAEDRVTLVHAGRGVTRPLDQFGIDAWALISRRLSFAELVLELTAARREPPHLVRTRLISWLGELLVLRLIRREPGTAEAGEA